jgi:hypothetical protein
MKMGIVATRKSPILRNMAVVSPAIHFIMMVL